MEKCHVCGVMENCHVCSVMERPHVCGVMEKPYKHDMKGTQSRCCDGNLMYVL